MNKLNILKKVLSLVITLAIIFSISLSNNLNAQAEKYNMSYVYFDDPSLYSEKVSITQNSLNTISPSYFNINPDGGLKVTPVLNADFVDDMHSKGIKVVPFLSNHWDMDLGRLALQNRDILARQIAFVIQTYNLDGVNIDLENLNEDDRDNYTDFVRILRDVLPEGAELSVAVAANPYNFNTGWQGSYDYQGLAQYSDYLMLMTYDEHYQSGPPGPVASLPFMEQSIEYALQRVPKEKVVLGIPFYGRYWKNGKDYGGYGISLTTADKLITRYNGQISYDWQSMSPKAEITIPYDGETPSVFGNELTPGTYTIWFENEQSIKQKLELVKKYDIKGTGSWSLGQELASTWNYYDLWLNGKYYADAEGHWAKKAIIDVAVKGWMVGMPDGSFSPDTSLTRAEAAVLMVRALKLNQTDIVTPFTDITGHWAEKEIITANNNGIVIGDGYGNFSPDAPITREQLAVMIDRIIKLPEPGTNLSNTYSDISPERNYWSYGAILKLSGSGILNGLPNGMFYPSYNTTRAEMATIMTRITGYIE